MIRVRIKMALLIPTQLCPYEVTSAGNPKSHWGGSNLHASDRVYKNKVVTRQAGKLKLCSSRGKHLSFLLSANWTQVAFSEERTLDASLKLWGHFPAGNTKGNHGARGRKACRIALTRGT